MPLSVHISEINVCAYIAPMPRSDSTQLVKMQEDLRGQRLDQEEIACLGYSKGTEAKIIE